MTSSDETALSTSRMPPQNIQAEMAVIGSCCLFQGAIDDCGDLRPEHFYDNRNAKLWSVILELRNENTNIDVISLAEKLDSRKELEQIGGTQYLHDVMNAVPSWANAPYYAKLVRQTWCRRAVIYGCTDLVNLCYESADEQEVIRSAEKILGEAVDRATIRCDVLIRDVLAEVWNSIEERKQRRVAEGISTGFKGIDELVKVKGSQLIVIGARPACGKTSLAAQIGADLARRGISTLYVSLEMNKAELVERLLCAYGKISSDRLKSCDALTAQERDKILMACSEFSQFPLRIDDEPEMTVTTIASKARALHRKEGLGCLIVDYVQLVEPDDRRLIREQQVAFITRKLKQLSRELNIPVIALAQLNRQTEIRDSKRPRLSDLRESGAVEQDADIVMMLHRPDLYDPEDRPGEAIVIVAKNRAGKTGDVTLSWNGERCEFSDFSREAKQQRDADRASEAFGGKPSQDNWG